MPESEDVGTLLMDRRKDLLPHETEAHGPAEESKVSVADERDEAFQEFRADLAHESARRISRHVDACKREGLSFGRRMSADHSTDLLLALARERGTDVRALLNSAPPDSEPFLALASQADIEPWLHWQIESSGLADGFGVAIMEHLAHRRHKTRNDNALLIAVTEQVLQILTAAGVTVVALKGMDLMHRHYPRIDLRTATDVDLLIPRGQLVVALEALGRNGFTVPDPKQATHYIRSSHHLPIDSPGPLPVLIEIHWNLVQDYRYDLNVDELFERARPIDIGPHRILRLEDHDFVAHLLLHHLSHYFNRQLKWLIDLRQIVRSAEFSWAGVVDRLQRWGGLTAGAAAVAHLHRLDPATVTDEAQELLPLAAWRRLLVAPFRSRHPLDWVRDPERRWLQLYLAAIFLERPSRLPRWLFMRETRDTREGNNPLDDGQDRIKIPLGTRNDHDGTPPDA